MLCPRENRTNKLSLRYEGPTQQEQQRCGKSRSKNEFTFWVKISQIAGFVSYFFNITVHGVELHL